MELLISKNIARLRRDRNLTQDDLATALDVTPQAVSNWERGGYPDITLLPGIANFFGVTIDDDVQDVRNGGFGSTTRV